MRNLDRLALFAPLLACALCAFPQTSGPKAPDSNYSKEGVVVEKMATNATFQSDGTYTYEQNVRVRIQSNSGVGQYGILPFAYDASSGHIDVEKVEVIKADGSVIATPLDSIQDVTSQVSRDAPSYTDVREKHVTVRGLESGDTLEYSARWNIDKPLIPGQFWMAIQLSRYVVVLDEEVMISVPLGREVKIKSQQIQPAITETGDRRIYQWKTSNLENHNLAKEMEAQAYKIIKGLLPPPDILVSSFHTWDELGRWYYGLQEESVKPSPEVQAKAEELVHGLHDDDAKIRAIYDYVSLRYRYIGISFGTGHFLPHPASEVIGNLYGDCKDKHTLFASLLEAVGINAYPALINTHSAIDEDVPSPAQFNHMITVIPRKNGFEWLDTTPELSPAGYLVPALRGKPALVIMPGKAEFLKTPPGNSSLNGDSVVVTAKLAPDGTLQAHSEYEVSGDYGELFYRNAFRRVPEAQWKDFAQQRFLGGRLGGIITSVRASAPEQTGQPFSVAYDYTLKDFFGGDRRRFMIPLSPLGLPMVKDGDLDRRTPFWLGFAGEAQFEARIELPSGWLVSAPPSVTLQESFGEFQSTSEFKNGILTTRRRLWLKTDAINPDQLGVYRKFQKAVFDDYNRYVALEIPGQTSEKKPIVVPNAAPDHH